MKKIKWLVLASDYDEYGNLTGYRPIKKIGAWKHLNSPDLYPTFDNYWLAWGRACLLNAKSASLREALALGLPKMAKRKRSNQKPSSSKV